MIDAFCSGIRLTAPEKLDDRERYLMAEDYVDTVNDNISEFLAHRKNAMAISIERIQEDFPKLWERIDATGDLNSALEEFQQRHNKSHPRKLELTYRTKLFIKRSYLHLKWWISRNR